MEKNKGFDENPQEVEKLVTAFCKHEILLKEPPANKLKNFEIKQAQKMAYKEMAKELQLPNVASVKSHIRSLKTYALIKMRECVGLSLNQWRSGDRDALSYAPDWLKKLEEPWNLMEKAVKASLPGSGAYCSAERRMSHFVWELLGCAARAARRARDALAATRALASAASLRDYARALRLDLPQVHGIWIRYYDQAVLKLMDLINLGDRSESLSPSKRFTLQDWRVADVGLLYDFRLRVVTEASFEFAVTLHPMIILFKLMVAAKEKIDQRKAAQLKLDKAHTGRQNRHSGARTEAAGSTHNITRTNVTPLFRHYSENIVSMSQGQITIDLSGEGSSTTKESINKKTCNEYETAEIWALVHSKYTNCGRSASAVLLQRRWYELKQQTRSLLFGEAPAPLLIAMAKRFPYILTETWPSWRELVLTGQVFMDSDLEPYKIELYNMDLEVPDIDENVLIDEINNWSDDEVEIINENREVITVTDSDEEQTNDTINNINNKPKTADLPNDNDTNREETNVEREDDSFIKKLESLDPESARVKIIFEDDSDSDVNEYLNSSEKNYINVYDSNLDSDEKPDTTPCANNDINKTIAQYRKDTEINKTKDKVAGPSTECTNLNVKISNSNHNSDTSKHGNNLIKKLINDFYNDTDDNLNDLQTTSPTKEPNSFPGEDQDNTIKSESFVQSDDMTTEFETILESNDSLNGNIPNYAFNNGSDAKLNGLQTTSPTKEPNSLSRENPDNTVKSKAIEQSDDMKTELEATLENNDTINGDVPKSHVEDTNSANAGTFSNGQVPSHEGESLDTSVENKIDDSTKESTLVDGKLVRISHVILTPLEGIDEWKKFSKFNSINCRRFSVRNFAKPLQLTPKQLSNCRLFLVPIRVKRNGISSRINLEMKQMSKILKQKRNFLTKHLKLSRTYFSLQFWNERNIRLLELCKPLSVKLERLPRFVKKVELTDIDEVRRINKTILTAQVAPVTVGSNRTFVINPSSKPPATPSHPLVQPASVQPTLVQPSNVSLITENQESDVVPTINSTYNVKLPNESAVREMIKKIVRNGVVAKIPDAVYAWPQTASDDAEFGHKQRTLDKDIREMSARMLKQHEIVMEKNREKERPACVPKELKLDPNINCSQEWQRQKSQNLIYFNFKPAPDGQTDSDKNKPKNKNNHNTKKRNKKIKKRKENKLEANITSINEKVNGIQSTDKAASAVAKDLGKNDSSATLVNSCLSSDSDSETDRLVINLDNTTDADLKRKSVDTQSDIMCKLPKTDTNATTIVSNTKKIAPMSNIMCNIAKPNLNYTTILSNTKKFALQSDIVCNIAKPNSNAITIVSKTKKIALQSDIVCNIAKSNSNATTIVSNTKKIALQSDIVCNIAKPNSNATTIVSNTKKIATQSDIVCNIAKPNLNETTVVSNTKKIATQSDIVCNIAKPNLNDTTIVSNTKKIALQSDIVCNIAKPNLNDTTIVSNTKKIALQSDIVCNIAKPNLNDTTIVSNSKKIALQSDIVCNIAKPNLNDTTIVSNSKKIALQSDIVCNIAKPNLNDTTIVSNSKKIALQSDIVCNIAKPNLNDTTIVSNSKKIALQSDIVCNIAKPNLNDTTIVCNTKTIATQSDISCKIGKTDSNAVTIVNNTKNIAPSCVIDLCDDSNDDSNDVTAIDTLENGADDENLNVHDNKTNEVTPQIKIKIVKNKIEINGDCKSQVVEEKSEEVLTFLSKVAARIQATNMTKPVAPATAPAANNSTVYYVIKSVDKNKQTNETSELNTSDSIFKEATTNTTAYTQTIDTDADEVQDADVSVAANSSPMYYVMKIPDLQSGAATSYISPLPALAPQVPVIQSVPAMTQIPQQIQEYSPLTNLPTYHNNFGEVIDTTYANQLYGLTSMPIQRHNSLPMPVTSVTAWPSQTELNQDPLNMEWQTTNANQAIYPFTVTSGGSRSEIITDVNEASLSSAPWNKRKQSDVTVAPGMSATSDRSQDNRRSLHTQPKRTYPPKSRKIDKCS